MSVQQSALQFDKYRTPLELGHVSCAIADCKSKAKRSAWIYGVRVALLCPRHAREWECSWDASLEAGHEGLSVAA